MTNKLDMKKAYYRLDRNLLEKCFTKLVQKKMDKMDCGMYYDH